MIDEPASSSVWVAIAGYGTYAEANCAVSDLLNAHFPAEGVTIVGCDLRTEERVGDRLTWPRTIAAGLAGGGWFGIAFGILLLLLVAPRSGGWIMVVLTGALLGATCGAVVGAIACWQLSQQQDISANTAVIAATYRVECDRLYARAAAEYLTELGARTNDG